uniref:Exportin-2 n=1 Tax=Panstrongylus megistus TaxID=65343 RepID=A0A069DXB6_9HEMI
MEITEENLRTLSNYLNQTLSPDPNVRRPSEKFLVSVEGNKNYPILLLQLINNEAIELTVRVAGAINFKNYVKRNWSVEEGGQDKIHEEDREKVKALIVDSMLVAPALIQKQLSDAVSIIGKSDFPSKWPGLMQNMVEKFSTGDFHIINGILHTAHSIFKRYRYEFKAQALWEEIKFVLDTFAKPLTDLLVATHNLTATHANNPEALRIIYSSLLLICKIFYSLNFQDLPEFFEDNMNTWMPLFHSLLTTDVPCLASDNDNEPGLMEQLRSQICFNLGLYAQKYDEEFRPFLPEFVTDIWNLLVSTGLQAKYDLLVSNALQFLSTVAERDHYRNLFQDPNVLSNICEKVIIPNVNFREIDEELFEDNPEEYMRRDIEGADVDTRRRAACDLVKVLAQHFDEQVSQIFSQFVLAMLNEYSMDNHKWRQKDTALYIVTCLAERGSTTKHGVTKTCAMVSLDEFAKNHILPELEKDVNILPVIKADTIKYLIKFRSVLPPQILIASLQNVIRHIVADNIVVRSYAACTIEKMLVVRHDAVLLITEQTLTPLAGDLLKSLFHSLTLRGSEENEYTMKAIMRSFSTLQESVVPYLAELLPTLTEKLAAVSRNPTKPHFNHYLFETITLSIRIVCKKNPGAVVNFEEALFPIFQTILQQDVQEFVPYVMQVLSLMLELHPDISPAYIALYPCLLAPGLWERQSNVRALAQLLRAYVRNADATQFQTTVRVNGLLGVFQKLIATRSNDHEGFNLIQCMMECCPNHELEPFMKQIFLLLFQRLSSSKTTKYVKGILVFFCFYVLKYGANNFIEIVDSIQPMMFAMIVDRLFIPDAQKISGKIERKIAIAGLAKMLSESKHLREKMYLQYWNVLTKILINMLELPVDETINPEEDFIVDVENMPGYEGTYNKLIYANKIEHDPVKALSNFAVSDTLYNSLSQPQVAHLKAILQ